MLSEQRNRLRFATIRSKCNNGLNMTRVYYNIKPLNAVYKLDNYAESPTKNVLTPQSCYANTCNLLSYLNVSSRKRSCVWYHPVAKPARKFGHAMQILNHHY
jgi:hypothetical protein